MPRFHVAHERPRRIVGLAAQLTDLLAGAIERTKPVTAQLLSRHPGLFYENFPGPEGSSTLWRIQRAFLRNLGHPLQPLGDGTQRFRWVGAQVAGAEEVLSR